jgi:hypothetical protein
MAPDVIDDIFSRDLLVGGVSQASDCGKESNPAPLTGVTTRSSNVPITVAPKYCSTTIQGAPERIVTPATEPTS